MPNPMTPEFKAAEGFPVGEYLKDELDARGWTTRDCAERMGGDVDRDTLALDFLLAVVESPDDHKIHTLTLDEGTARGLEVAMGSSAETWLNLDRAYHKWRAERKVQ